MTQVIENDFVFSRLADDPLYAEMIQLYVEEMPDRIADLEQAVQQGDRETMRRLAHQLKGSAGTYGFEDVTDIAERANQAIMNDADSASIEQAFQKLIRICRKMRAGSKC